MHGALEISVGPSPSPSVSPSPSPSGTPTYTRVQSEVLTPNCNSCHSGATPSAGLDFTTWNNLVHNTVVNNLVVPGNPQQSLLFTEAQHNTTLTTEQMQLLSDWISAGALNN
jgi:hypothetical protein